jgi:predicted nucleic acid-binding protein
MILADTSLWIDLFRGGGARLEAALNDANVVTHPFVIGELACGNLRRRREAIAFLDSLPSATVATDDEVMELIENRKLMGRGIGYVDAHLLAAAALSHDVAFWTLDARLANVAKDLGLD